WCVVPVYNNAATVKEVALACRRHLEHVLVVDDGSTDADVSALLSDTDVKVVCHRENKGKGQALLTALCHVKEQGGAWMVTVDADGQHDPADIPTFLPMLEKHPHSILVGARDFSAENIPGGSRFGRKFSNFWIKLECGASVSDSQSGFRAYPVDLVSQIKLRGSRYDFEVEVLSKAVWHGLSLTDVPVGVHYPPPEERISHFDQWKDNVRLTGRHSLLVARRLLPWPHRKLVKPEATDWKNLLKHPRRFLAMLLKENSSPVELGTAAGVGVLLATLPLIACHTIAILYVSTKLNLNRLLAVNVQHFCAPPFVPLACIALGFRLRNGHWLGVEELRTFASDLHQHLLNWLIGSLVLAPVLALLAGGLVFYIASRVRRKGAENYV
ncbi:MAG: glycosyltransferase family 2 protein, partial [Verrucomicrobiota bacterium]